MQPEFVRMKEDADDDDDDVEFKADSPKHKWDVEAIIWFSLDFSWQNEH